MTNTVERLRSWATCYESAPWSLLEDAADELARLRGEAKVLRDLLREAAGVLETIDSEDDAERDELTALLAAIGGALQGAQA
jgi:chromosome condensin MukBEF complex kleisin-like MukF subunit